MWEIREQKITYHMRRVRHSLHHLSAGWQDDPYDSGAIGLEACLGHSRYLEEHH